MLRQDQRWVSHCLLTLRPADSQAEELGLEKVLDGLRTRIVRQQARMLMEKKSVAFGLTRVQLNRRAKCVTFLFQAYDNRAADPGFGNFEEFTVRYARKAAGEGGASAAQLVVSLEESEPGNKSYFALLETVPGITRTRVERLLTAVAKDVSEDLGLTYVSPITGKDLKNRPIIGLRARPSLTLRNALKTNTLKGVTLVKTDIGNDGLDEGKWVRDRREELSFKVKDGIGPRSAMALIRNLVRVGKTRESQHMEVRVSNDKRVASLEIDLEESSPADALLIQHDLVELTTPHPVPRTTMSTELQAKMIAILERVRTKPLGG